MGMTNCHHCGKLFLSAGDACCPECVEAEENGFAAVSSYLRQHPGARLDEVARGTGLRPDTILRYLRQGRLQVSGS